MAPHKTRHTLALRVALLVLAGGALCGCASDAAWHASAPKLDTIPRAMVEACIRKRHAKGTMSPAWDTFCAAHRL